MSAAVHITPSTFARVFRRFQRQVELAENSPGPFVNFQSGLAYSMEHYKEWLYLEARRRLNVEEWTETMVGTGAILKAVRNAIEIKEDNEHRNNIVGWEARYGEDAVSHRRLLDAADDKVKRRKAEKALWEMYASEADPELCFGILVELFGGRYDLISYLFFIRDWNTFMPVKSSFFPHVFERLGVPLRMMKQCHWENYAGVLARLREVQRHLEGYDIPNGIRLIDAHSFCWMLNSLDEPPDESVIATNITPLVPEAGEGPIFGRDGNGTTQEELERNQRQQKRVGDLAQAIVLNEERKRLTQQGRNDLAQRVRDVSNDVTLGYDIESFTQEGVPKPIEVKAAAKRGADCRFFLSENEKQKARDLPNYYFILVFDVESKTPVLREFAGSALPANALHPVQYEVRLKRPRK